MGGRQRLLWTGAGILAALGLAAAAWALVRPSEELFPYEAELAACIEFVGNDLSNPTTGKPAPEDYLRDSIWTDTSRGDFRLGGDVWVTNMMNQRTLQRFGCHFRDGEVFAHAQKPIP